MCAKITIFLLVLAIPAIHAVEPELRLEQIHTNKGETYHQVQLLKADGAGAYIRHSRGLARIPYRDLPAEIRNQFENLARPVMGEEREFQPKAAQNAKTAQSRPIRWVVVQIPPAPAVSTAGCATVFGHHPCTLPYPHSLAIYPCRKAAELDFLYVTGILRRPPGVGIHRLWSTRFF